MNPYLRFGTAQEPVAWAVLLASVVALLVVVRRRDLDLSGTAHLGWLVALACGAALLSSGYLLHYLRGGPRIVDATYYYLQGRALAEGMFAFPVPEPRASFSGRFLLSVPEAKLGVLFPPGYPVALAAAFRAGVPLALGPLLAALLVPVTYWLARELGAPRHAALGASALSMLCAALRYHTADTMAHGFSALLLATTVAAAARASLASLLLSGLCAGWLLATRPITGAVALLGAGLLARPAKWKAFALLPALIPGIGLLLVQQRAVTGDWSGSTQLAYYAAADGPPGCFRYGFGTGIGCWFEHGDFVRARLAEGYGLAAAVGNTLRRLGVHALDIANAAPLAPLVLYGAWFMRRKRKARLGFGIALGVILAYTPFYFEGSYPGGGARFYADVLPIEHALLAQGLFALGALRFAWPIALFGFALHTHQQHALLRDREGGRPMFEPGVLEQAGVTHGLVFVTTDHGFALGHRPGQLSAHQSVVVARQRRDGLDRRVWESLDRPPSFLYSYDARQPAAHPTVVPLNPKHWSRTRIEAENLWPPLRVISGWARPTFSADTCCSAGRGLLLEKASGPTRLRLGLPAPGAGAQLRLGWHGLSPPSLRIHWPLLPRAPRWEANQPGCWRSMPLGPLPEGRPLELELEGTGLLDYIELLEAQVGKGVDN